MVSGSLMPSTASGPNDFDIKIATEADKSRIVEFLRKFFFTDEPLCKYLSLCANGKINKDLERFACSEIEDPSLLAELDGKLIGVCLNCVMERNHKQEEFVTHDDEFKKVFDVLNSVPKDSDPFQYFPEAKKAMAVKIVSVDHSYRGKGIAKHLMAKTRELARERGCGFMTVDCTSHFTAMALKRLGFDQIYSLDYADYKPQGEVVFAPEAPHKAVTVYVQKI